MKYSITLFLLVTCFSAKAQNDSLQFPQDFYGIYKGDLKITNPKGEQTIAMEFHLNKTDSIGKHQYMLVYIFDGKRQERNYTLIKKEDSKNDYILDENNGITLDAKLVNNNLYFIFEVQGSLLTTTLYFHEKSMNFEIYSY
jgi:hypothetical protein